MEYKHTTALDKILKMNKRLRIVQGGARAGKTVAILLILIDIAQTQKNKVISVVSETMPHLRKGCIRDFLDIMEGHNLFEASRWKQSPEYIYTFESGSIIEFFSADSADKVRGPTRNILFINECNNVPFETYQQLIIRTSDYIYLDYNPVAEFWVHQEVIPKQEHDFDIITYLDNEYLPEEIKKEIESRKGNRYFWQVYGLGQIGENEYKIYVDWNIVDEIPHEARLERYGLDFGYSSDPTAIIAVYYFNGGYILDEITYQKGLTNKQISDILNNLPKALVMADSAEPKSIDEIKALMSCLVKKVKEALTKASNL
jgi:phage terminase large subunit